MDISSLPRIDVSSTVYSERYAVYIAYSNKVKMMEWISDRFDEEITYHLPNNGDLKLSILGIGSGDGKFEVKMIMKLKKKFRLIDCTVVEPSTERMASYRKLVKDEKNALDGVTFDWRQETFQEFCKANPDPSKKFHFVSLIHCAYYFHKRDLDYYMDVITRWTEGKILIMQDADVSIFGLLDKKFPGVYNGLRPLILGDTIMDSFKTLGMSFETSSLPCELDITACFDNDSRDGKLLLDFLLQVVGLVDDGPPEALKMVKEFLKSEGFSYTRNGRNWVENPTQVIIITPTSRKM